MEFKELSLKGLVEITPRLLEDERGFFYESYSRRTFSKNGLDLEFVQDNQSFSHKGVVRGLHFQNPPFAQGKLVRVVVGRALDVVVDIRKDSSTYGKHLTVELDSKTCNMLYVPPGFAHGFAALTDVVFFYKCTGLYDKASEGGLLWNDPVLEIDWRVSNPVVSEKDMVLPSLENLISGF
ncbi:MAG: dTDP-4-dehydrorhamnose 3,5-epimerase [Bacteroidota bacterium]